VKTVLILDLDVHQGDGTATIFAADPSVFTCSVHMRRSFPLRKQASDLDVPLEDGVGDDEYLQLCVRLYSLCDAGVSAMAMASARVWLQLALFADDAQRIR
jgi:acetoin utilization deacetylase AcuC-like enzyme